MRYLIIPDELVEKLQSMEFDGFNKLNPVEGELSGRKVFFLQEELRDNKIFSKVLDDFKVCEVKDLNVDVKCLDGKGEEVQPTSEKIAIIKNIISETIKK